MPKYEVFAARDGNIFHEAFECPDKEAADISARKLVAKEFRITEAFRQAQVDEDMSHFDAELDGITVTDIACKVFIVSGVHFMIPGRPVEVFSTLKKAQDYALDLTNMLRESVDLPPRADSKRWERLLEAARRKRAYDLQYEHFSDLEDEPEDDGWVEIIERPLDPERAQW